jgi:hypothetical protein
MYPPKLVDKDLWEVFRLPNTRTRFLLFRKTKSTFLRKGQLTMKFEVSGQVWECRFEPDVLLIGTDRDEQGVVVARVVNEIIVKRGNRDDKENEVDDAMRTFPCLTFLERRNGGRIIFWSILRPRFGVLRRGVRRLGEVEEMGRG